MSKIWPKRCKNAKIMSYRGPISLKLIPAKFPKSLLAKNNSVKVHTVLEVPQPPSIQIGIEENETKYYLSVK